MTLRLTTLAVASAVALAGCIERTEHLVVESDGVVRMHLEFQTRSFDELYAGDAAPTLEGGWVVVETTERDAEGEEVFRLVADAEFGADEPLPASYEGPTHLDPGTSISFPTTVTFEDRFDGTYVHFARRYEARPWAYLEHARELLRSQLAELGVDDFETAAPAEREQLMRLFARVKTMEQQVFARAAFRATVPKAPQDAWLALHAALARMAAEYDYARLAALLARRPAERAGQASDDELLAAEEAAFRAAALEAMEVILTDRGVSRGNVNAFVNRYRWESRFHEITGELEDDKFTVRVTMPGAIVGHNGESAQGPTVTWTFTGAMFRDRDLELMATSRLE